MTRNRAIHETPGTARARRGNIMILVVVVLVLLALLGATYLQVARVQRSVVDEPIDNIDEVLESVIEKIKTVLKDDVHTGGANPILFGTDIEPYDFPSTNYGSAGQDVIGLNATYAGAANFGQNDDAWLANTIPYDNAGTLTWRNITTLCGGFFDTENPLDPALLRNVTTALNNPGNEGSEIRFPASTVDSDVPITDGNLVDTDGDGIGDAKYERAPLIQKSGREYFMAVRIVDASSLINLNAATAISPNGAATGAQVTGYFPTSLDLSRLAFRQTRPVATDWLAFFDVLFADGGLRDLDGTVNGTPIGAGDTYETPFGLNDPADYDPFDRYPRSPVTPPSPGYGNGQLAAWLEGAAIPGDLSNYVPALTELHWRGGMDDPDRDTVYENLGTPADEMLDTPYTPATNNNNPVTATNTAEQHFFGDAPGDPLNSDFNAVRHMLTTVSGHSVYSPNFANMHGGFALMEDLVYRQTGLNGSAADSQARADRLTDAFERIFALGAGYPTNAPADQRLAAAEYALAIQEYSDPDGTPSAVYNDGTDDYYGLEVLPFLREVYFQVGYEDGDAATEPSDWGPVADSYGVVVEVANPFDRPINLGGADDPNIRMVLISRTGGVDSIIANSEYNLSTGLPATAPAINQILPADNRAAPTSDRHIVAIYSNGSAAFDENDSTGAPIGGSDLRTDVIDAAGTAAQAGYNIVDAGDNLAENIPIDGTELGVALQVEVVDSGGTPVWVTYDRLFDPSLSFPTDVPFSSTDAFGTPGTEPLSPVIERAYIQKSLKRDDTQIRYLSNQGKAVAPREPNLTPPINGVLGWPQGDGGYSGTTDSFAGDANGVSGDLTLDTLQIPIANRPIFSIAELGWIFMFGFSSANNGDFPQRFSGPGPAAGGIPDNERFLQFSGGVGSDVAIADVNNDAIDDVTYATAVLSEFTTLHPGYDGIDNDGDNDIDITGVPADDDEQFIFGTININTVPEHLAVYSAPYPDSLANTQTRMQDIIDRRDGIGAYAGAPQPYGTIGELAYHVINTTPPGPQLLFDLYPLAENRAPNGAQAEQYVINGSAEEAMKQAQFLLQSYSVRSDIYIAFIVVKGYKSGAFEEGVKESARAIVILDRGRLTGATTDRVIELGRYRY